MTEWKRTRTFASLLALAAIPLSVSGAGLSLTSFTNGQPADALEVNGNFEALATELAAVKSDAGGVGDVRYSILSLAAFQSIHGSDWALMNGDSHPASKLCVDFGVCTLPDARGVFLRGKNNGRSDGMENPAGELALGAYQADEFKEHTHQSPPISTSADTNSPAGTRPVVGYYTTSTNQFTTTPAGGNETRPKNLTVNTFIKIN